MLADLRGIRKVSNHIGELFLQFIKFPDIDGARRLYQEFYRIAQFPGVVGCIDGTYVPIKNPGGENAEVFRNRLGVFSFNCQVRIVANFIINYL